MEKKKFQSVSIAALIVSILPLAALAPSLLHLSLSDGVRTAWAGANIVFVLLGLILSVVCVRNRESRSVININTVRKEVMSLTRAYFGELQASIEQDINQPVRQEIDAFFCAFREKVEQLRNTLIQRSEDHKRDQQAQERLTRRLQALNERVPELITDSKALREELETML